MGLDSGGMGPCCLQVAEKLEKSEAGRKKLRQAISLLKEKMEATEKVLQVNETLRQDLEKERKRAISEANNAKEQKRLREELEENQSNRSHEMSALLRRLDEVEKCQKTDHDAVQRLLSEVGQAVKGLGSCILSLESAQKTFDVLEKNLLSKVNDAAQASEKATSMAKSVQSTASSAQTACVSAETVAKTAQAAAMSAEREVQTLSARVVSLQKQSSMLEQRFATLLREGTRAHDDVNVAVSLDGVDNRVAIGLAKPKSKSKFGRGMVLSKNQLQNTRLGNIEGPVDGAPVVANGTIQASEKEGTVIRNFPSSAFSALTASNSAEAGARHAKSAARTLIQKQSARFESLQKDNGMLDQRLSIQLQEAVKTREDGIFSASLDSVPDRFSSAFIRPRNRSRPQSGILPSDAHGQRGFRIDCGQKDVGGNVVALDFADLGSVKGKKSSSGQLCSASAADSSIAQTIQKPATESMPVKLVESITRLLHKSNKTHTKMESKLEALQEALVKTKSDVGHKRALDVLQKSGNKRKRCGNSEGGADMDADGQKQGMERKRAGKEKKKLKKHHKVQSGNPLTGVASSEPRERSDTIGKLSSTVVKADAQNIVPHVASTSGNCEMFANRSMEGGDPMATEDCGALQLFQGDVDALPLLKEGGSAVAVSGWKLDSECDDELWTDWLAGRLELLSPSLPTISIATLSSGPESDHDCTLMVEAAATEGHTGTNGAGTGNRNMDVNLMPAHMNSNVEDENLSTSSLSEQGCSPIVGPADSLEHMNPSGTKTCIKVKDSEPWQVDAAQGEDKDCPTSAQQTNLIHVEDLMKALEMDLQDTPEVGSEHCFPPMMDPENGNKHRVSQLMTELCKDLQGAGQKCDGKILTDVSCAAAEPGAESVSVEHATHHGTKDSVRDQVVVGPSDAQSMGEKSSLT